MSVLFVGHCSQDVCGRDGGGGGDGGGEGGGDGGVQVQVNKYLEELETFY